MQVKKDDQPNKGLPGAIKRKSRLEKKEGGDLRGI